MNQSGVGVHPDVSAAFHRSDSKALLLSIQEGEFRLLKSFTESDDSKLFQMLEPRFKETDPCIVLLKEDGKWVLLAWTPDAASVNLRMLYASSRAGLKVSLGSTYFLPDWHLSTDADFQLIRFKDHLKHSSLATVMTSDEKAAEAVYRESQPSSVKQNAMQKMDMTQNPDLVSALSDFNKMRLKHITIALTEKQESFTVECSGDETDLDALGRSLPASEPRFILLNDGEENILIHYCPEASDRVLKMAYSAFKRNLMDTVSTQSITLNRSVQVSEQHEFTASLLSSKTPEKTSLFKSQQQFSKPSRPGRGAARLNR